MSCKGKLPVEDELAQVVTLTQSQYTIVNRVLYCMQGYGTLRIVPLNGDREALFQEAHAGAFSGHLRDVKVYGELLLVAEDEGFHIAILDCTR